MKYIDSSKLFHHPERLTDFLKGKSPMPISVEIHISNKCNNNCFYCIAEKQRDGKMMEWNGILKTVYFLKHLGVKGVVLSGGGEPTMHDNFSETLQLIHSSGMDVGVITNGVSLDEKNQEAVLEYATWIRISLDSIYNETYKEIRGTNHYKIVFNNIQELFERKEKKKSKTTVGVQFVINEHNMDFAHQVLGFLDFFKELDYIQVRPVEYKGQPPYTKFQLDKIKYEIGLVSNNKKVLISEKWKYFYEELPEVKVCHASDFIGAVDAYGNFYLCCHMVGNQKYFFINVFDSWPTAFKEARLNVIEALPGKGYDELFCPKECRGAPLNRCLDRYIKNHFKQDNHNNFL